MLNASFKKLAIIGSMAFAFALTGCLQGEDTQETAATHFHVKADIGALNATSGNLAKGAQINLAKVIIVLTSNGSPADTVRDTIVTGQQGFTSNSGVNQTIDSVYVLKALRNWKVVVTVKDSKDSVTHRDSITPAGSNFTRINDTVVVSFGTLTPKFQQYRAVFPALPDSITTSATSNKQGVRFTRLIMRIDGKIVKDSLNGSFFNGGALDTLDYDYVSPGSHVIRLAAYGSVYNAAGVAIGSADTLFVGQGTFVSTAGVDDAQSISLAWTNLNNNKGTESVSVTIGKVGRTTVSGTTSGTNVVPKGSAR
jgi:hypothetical protein